jgi:hypothetical protein
VNKQDSDVQKCKFQRMRRVLQFGGDNFKWIGRGAVRVHIIGRKYKFKAAVSKEQAEREFLRLTSDMDRGRK